MMKQEKIRIGVVGAGLSGLTAAERILREGKNRFDVVVIEAMDRVGGRTQTSDIQGAKFDLGGQWVGPKQEHVRELAERSGNKLVQQYHKGAKILHFNQQISTYRTNIPFNVGILALIQMQFCIYKLDSMAKKINPQNPHSIDNPLTLLWDSMTVKTWVDQNVYFHNVKLLFQCAVRAILGVETNEVSFLFFLWYIRQNDCIDSLVNIQKGHQQKKMQHGSQYLSQYLKKGIEKMDGRILLNSPVYKIKKKQKNRDCENEFYYEIVLVNQEKIECDYIILAMPPARVNRIQFVPQLSRQRRMICSRNFMGTITKVHILYKQAYWKELGFSGQTLSDCVEHPIFNAYDDTKVKENGEEQPALLVFINASVDRDWSLHSNREYAQKVILETLAKYFKTQKMKEPINVHWKCWNEEHSLNGGPVAVFPPGVLSKIEDIRKPEERIHWAGTEMAQVSQGFMDGAIQSGKRAADEILTACFSKQTRIRQQQKKKQPQQGWYTRIIKANNKYFQWL